MATPLVMQYSADYNAAIKSISTAIARLDYTLKGVDNQNGIISFEAGMSMSSWAGQSMSVHVLQVDQGVQVTVGGNMKAHGALLQLYDWGESKSIATRVFDQIDTVLGPGQLVSGSTQNGFGPVVIGAAVFIFVAILLLIIVIQQ